MKKIFVILFFYCMNVYSQWDLVNPKSFGGITSACLASKNSVWFATKNGYLYRLNLLTKKAEKVYKSSCDILNISFIDSNNGFISGSDGLLRTSNAGANWETISTVNKMTLFFTKEKGIHVWEYQGIYYTGDGGYNWDKKAGCYILGFFQMVNNFYGTIISYMPVSPTYYSYSYLKTTNSGESWQSYDPKSLTPTEKVFQKVSLQSKPEYYTNPSEQFPNSIDPNLQHILTNISQTSLEVYPSVIKQIWITDQNVNYAFLSNNDNQNFSVSKTTDAGITWKDMFSTSHDYSTLISFRMFDTNYGVLINNNKILFTRDGCSSFETIIDINTFNAINEDMLDLCSDAYGNISVISSSGSIIKSANNGDTWDIYKSNSIGTLKKAKFFDANTCYSVSSNAFYKTLDAGSTWQKFDLSKQLIGNASILNMFFIDKDYGWICAENHTIFLTTDAGSTWKSKSLDIQSPSNDHVQSSFFFDRKFGYFLVGERFIWKTTDGGESFTKTPMNDEFYVIKALSVFSQNELWASTLGFGLRISTDGGINWRLASPPNNDPSTYDYPRNTLYSFDNGVKYLPSTYYGQLYVSNNQGNDWIKFNLVNEDLQIVFFNMVQTQNKNLWLLGKKGTIFRSVYKTDSTEIPKQIPSTFSVSQNYPNPFNPETTIEYQLPTPGFVTLKVYDVIGREVATLVNEFKQAGTYNSKLNTQNYNLTSGVYFYRLQTGRNSQTKKLILMK